MTPFIEKIRSQFHRYNYNKKLGTLYADMDAKYHEAATYYGFQCTGCDDNCCFTRFYHHTFVECLYILDGMDTIAPEKRTVIKNRAVQVCKQVDAADKKRGAVRVLCPLNDGALCTLYSFRPMICRLHGIPHELNISVQGIRQNPGCDYFMNQYDHKDYFPFDRTSIYKEMANLEKEFRQKTGITDKIKQTVAEMICADPF